MVVSAGVCCGGIKKCRFQKAVAAESRVQRFFEWFGINRKERKERKELDSRVQKFFGWFSG